jgi:AcrR family transcriptional regulator
MARQKDDKKKDKIISAARKLVIKTGFTSLRMAQVAKEAGVATGTLYTYYENKSALINDVYTSTKKEIISLLANPKHQSDSTYRTLKNMWMAYFNFCHIHPEKMLFVEQFIYSGYIDEKIISKIEEGLAEVFKPVEQAQNEKIVKQVPLKVLQSQIQAPVHDLIKLIQKKEIELNTELINTCFEMTWDAIKA